MPDYRLMYSKSSAAEALSVSRPVIDQKIKAGLLQTVADENGRVFVDGDSLRAYYEGLKARQETLKREAAAKADRIIKRLKKAA